MSERDVTDALRLSREHIYGGAEPYAPAVPSFARMLEEHRHEIERETVELLGARAEWRCPACGESVVGPTLRHDEWSSHAPTQPEVDDRPYYYWRPREGGDVTLVRVVRNGRGSLFAVSADWPDSRPLEALGGQWCAVQGPPC